MFEKLKFKTRKLSLSYPVPININTFWNFGALGFFFLITQIITGIFLAMHYIPSTTNAFVSIEHIMRDINLGWYLRYFHSNGASLFFVVVYIHMFRGLMYGSYMYPRGAVWMMGVIILLLMIITAFLGYVLPWGQMSYWAATVITSLASVIPVVGDDVVVWLWGGFSVGGPTLGRFFSLHFIFPIIIVLLCIFHIAVLHITLSGNPLGSQPDVDEVAFAPYFVIKDINSIVCILGLLNIFVFFFPDFLGHPDNYNMANPLVTPNHIVPEWYFLIFYAILRSVPNKALGVILLVCSILVLILLPFIVSYELRSTSYKFVLRFVCYVFLGNCFILGWIGGKEIITPYYEIGQICTIFYFLFFLVILPFLHKRV